MSAFLRTVRLGLLTAAIAAVWALIPTASASAAGPNAVRNLDRLYGTNTLAGKRRRLDGRGAASASPQTSSEIHVLTQLYVNNNGNVTFD